MHLEFLLENVNHVGTHNSPLFLKDDVTQQGGDLEESPQAGGPLPCGLYLIASLPGASTRARTERCSVVASQPAAARTAREEDGALSVSTTVRRRSRKPASASFSLFGSSGSSEMVLFTSLA